MREILFRGILPMNLKLLLIAIQLITQNKVQRFNVRTFRGNLSPLRGEGGSGNLVHGINLRSFAVGKSLFVSASAGLRGDREGRSVGCYGKRVLLHVCIGSEVSLVSLAAAELLAKGGFV